MHEITEDHIRYQTNQTLKIYQFDLPASPHTTYFPRLRNSPENLLARLDWCFILTCERAKCPCRKWY